MRATPRIHTRRDVLRTGLLAVAGAGLAAACGTTSTAATAAGSSTTATTPAPSTAAGTSAAAATSAARSTATAGSAVAVSYPIVMTHEFGTTTIKSAPQRVLSLGYTDHEVLLALGIEPIGVIQWIPEWKKGVSSWSEKLLEGTTPALFQYELDFEKAAALRPDLILNIGFDPDKKTYDTLSAIAPTIAPPKGVKPYGVAWEQMTTLVSTAVGRKADGDKLIAQTKSLMLKTAADNPLFKGKTFSLGSIYQSQIGYYTKSDIRNQLMRQLGFVDNAFISGLKEDNFYGMLSPENVDSLDADLLVFFADPGTTRAALLKAYPSLATVPAVKAGRMLLLTDRQDAMAFSASSVLSIPIALDALVPAARKILA